LEKSLANYGFSKSDITDILLTHLHFDHAGGATDYAQNGELIPAFPNAQYWVSKKNWEWANQPVEKDKASYLKENFICLMEAKVLNLVDKFEEIGISLLESFASEGHTSGMLLPIFHGKKETIIYCADLIPTSSHISAAYVMGYDLRPLDSMKEKKEITEKALINNWRLFFEHDPFYASAKLTKNESGILNCTEYDSVLRNP
jgi:glyoxylase-like metal-dependent hydrolase (beta-lactamase superfamily II)